MQQPQTTGMPVSQPQNNNKKYWTIGGIILVLAIAGFALLNRDTTTPPQGIAVGDQNSLDIGDQNPDGVVVLVSQASFIKPGFIIIQENLNGLPGKILATSNLFSPGFYTNKTVTMTMQPGASYFGTLYGDDGNGFFSAANDQPLTDPAGAFVRVPFRARMSSTPDDIKG